MKTTPFTAAHSNIAHMLECQYGYGLNCEFLYRYDYGKNNFCPQK